MKPGETARPSASMVRDAAPLILPISTILPSLTARSPRKAGIPEPSTMRPLRISRSYAILVGLLLWVRPGATLPRQGSLAPLGLGGKAAGWRAFAIAAQDCSAFRFSKQTLND